MKHSEFYEAVEATFGSALGRSYVSDLYLASLGATASPSRLERALERLEAAQQASRRTLAQAA